MKLVFGCIIVWLVFVLSLSTWWMIYGLRTLELLASGSETVSSIELLRQQTMLFYEGTVLALMQILGAVFLFYFAYRMYKEKAAAESFFGSFTHDLKTSLFRVQLGVDQLCQDGVPRSQHLLLQTRNLQRHLENGLDTILGQKRPLVSEVVSMPNFISELHGAWPGVSFQLSGEKEVTCDHLALKSIFENLIHNSTFHGKASEVFVNLISQGSRRILSYWDNGEPFSKDIHSIGKNPSPQGQGSGYGLYLVRFWVNKMGGRIRFLKTESQSLKVEIVLQKGSNR